MVKVGFISLSAHELKIPHRASAEIFFLSFPTVRVEFTISVIADICSKLFVGKTLLYVAAFVHPFEFLRKVSVLGSCRIRWLSARIF